MHNPLNINSLSNNIGKYLEHVSHELRKLEHLLSLIYENDAPCFIDLDVNRRLSWNHKKKKVIFSLNGIEMPFSETTAIIRLKYSQDLKYLLREAIDMLQSVDPDIYHIISHFLPEKDGVVELPDQYGNITKADLCQ